MPAALALGRIPANATTTTATTTAVATAATAPVAAQHAVANPHRQELVRHLNEPLVAGNDIQLLQDGPATFEAMFRAIDAARDHINLESYIVEADGPGQELADRLIARRRAGVKVNLLFDGIGSFGTDGEYFERLSAAGVALCEYNPVSRWKLWLGQALHLRDHRKLLVVDGRVGFLGGINISSVYSSGSSPLHASAQPGADKCGWRDLHLRIEGPVVQSVQQLFMKHWHAHAGQPLQDAHYLPPLAVVGQQSAALAATEAGRRRNPHFSALLGAIGTARRSILLTTAYLAPPRRLLRALVKAAERGVRVELLLPGASDFNMAWHAGHSHFTKLLRAGVVIHERQGSMLHSKACVIDGEWCSVGSSNADWRSAIHNAEANLIVLDEGFGEQLERAFQDDVACSQQVQLDSWQQRPQLQRWKEQLARRFEFFL
jgi:cardiolipin synthase